MRDDFDFWTEEQDKLLREMYGKYSYSQICDLLGRSRSAVAGRVRRLKLSESAVKPQKVPRQDGEKELQKMRVVASRQVVLRKKLNPRPPVYHGTDMDRVARYMAGVCEPVTPEMVKLIDLKNHHCRRPVDTEQGVLFCGRTIDDRYKSYCDQCGPYLLRPIEPYRRRRK